MDGVSIVSLSCLMQDVMFSCCFHLCICLILCFIRLSSYCISMLFCLFYYISLGLCLSLSLFELL